MLYHIPTGQLFGSKQQAQKVLKVLSPELAEVATPPRPTTAWNERATLDRTTPVEVEPGVWQFQWTVETLSQVEQDDLLLAQLDAATGESNDRDKAIAFLLADLWLYVQTGKTPNQATAQEIQTARSQVRSRLNTHLRDIKGI